MQRCRAGCSGRTLITAGKPFAEAGMPSAPEPARTIAVLFLSPCDYLKALSTRGSSWRRTCGSFRFFCFFSGERDGAAVRDQDLAIAQVRGQNLPAPALRYRHRRRGAPRCAGAVTRKLEVNAWARAGIFDSISASPTAFPLRGYWRAVTQNDRLGEAAFLSTGTPIRAQWTCHRRCRNSVAYAVSAQT